MPILQLWVKTSRNLREAMKILKQAEDCCLVRYHQHKSSAEKTDKCELYLPEFASKLEGKNSMLSHTSSLPVFVKFCTQKYLHNTYCLVRNILQHNHKIFQ